MDGEGVEEKKVKEDNNKKGEGKENHNSLLLKKIRTKIVNKKNRT